MTELAVSVVVNNHNYARFLPEAIESALSQAHHDVEVIVVDDGSTDGSRSVIEAHGERVRSIFTENGGQASAYNVGYAACGGDIVYFLDADDIVDPTTLAEAAAAFASADVVRVQWAMRIIDAEGRSDGRITTVVPPPDGDLLDRVLADGPLYDFNHHTNAAYRRSFLDVVLPMPEAAYRNGADVYLTTVAPVYGRVCTLDGVRGAYRIHGANNYAASALTDDRLREYVRRFDVNCDALERALLQRGLAPNVGQWQATSFNRLWPSRLLDLRQAVRQHVPADAAFLLLDDAEWGDPVDASLAGHQPVRLGARDGEYWGPPSDSASAREAILGLHRVGVRHVVRWWTTKWWDDCYADLMCWMSDSTETVYASPAGTILRLPAELC